MELCPCSLVPSRPVWRDFSLCFDVTLPYISAFSLHLCPTETKAWILTLLDEFFPSKQTYVCYDICLLYVTFPWPGFSLYSPSSSLQNICWNLYASTLKHRHRHIGAFLTVTSKGSFGTDARLGVTQNCQYSDMGNISNSLRGSF